jgi:hypothetical protein
MGSTSGMDLDIRTGLRPGDVGEITRLHGEIYAVEHGLDATFEGSVAAALTQCMNAQGEARRPEPRPS